MTNKLTGVFEYQVVKPFEIELPEGISVDDVDRVAAVWDEIWLVMEDGSQISLGKEESFVCPTEYHDFKRPDYIVVNETGFSDYV